MLEFLQNNYFIFFYAVAMAYSVIKYRFYYDTVLKYLPIVIAYTLLSEILGILIRDVESYQIVYEKGYAYYNQLIYNIFDIVFFLYFFFIYWKTIHSTRAKKIIKFGVVFFIVVTITNMFIYDIMKFPQVYSILVGSATLIFCVLQYLSQLNKATEKKKNLLFWISIGLITFYSLYPFIMLIGMVDSQLYQNLQLHTLLRVSIVVMYGFFIIGFVKIKSHLKL